MKTSSIPVIKPSEEVIVRPAGLSKEAAWKVKAVRKILAVLQHISPRKTAEVIRFCITRPGRAKFSEAHLKLLEAAEVIESRYKGDRIMAYRWGVRGRKVLLCHGWGSKTADFRRMIEGLLKEGYVVEGVDMQAHGRSEGKHTSLPEYRDILKSHLISNGPYYAVVGYSFGATALGVALSEISRTLHPSYYFMLAAPPYAHFFLKKVIREIIGCNRWVYESFCDQIKATYQQPVEYFDLRIKSELLCHISTYLVYCEDDGLIGFQGGLELKSAWGHADFLSVKGLGHFKIMSDGSVINYILNTLKK